MARGPLRGKEVDAEISTGKRGRYLDDRRREIPDPKPLAPPLGYKREPSLAERIREMVRGERLAAEARASGKETFEEADDFAIDDEFDPNSPYEEDFDPPPTWESHGEKLGEALAIGMKRYETKLKEEEEKKSKKEKEKQPADPVPPKPE